ncbi:MAG: aldo/keto reductase [Prevotellaceae bacterium]|jgi:predicted aldo/keto reductase-like oxidoreductase|nr:aldo/keto reductase [Prevotellaceae bacterium]
MDRRKFIRTGVVGVAGLTIAGSGISCGISSGTVDRVKLGKSGLRVSRIAMGTGTSGYGKASNQTRLGMEKFVNLAHHAYEKGIRFYDMADGYGSQPFVGEAIKTLPRDKITLMTKIWTQPDGSENMGNVREIIDRCRKETGVEYFDILLMHCIMQGNWHETRKHYMDAFSKAKEDGTVRATGVSCHNIDALAEAAVNPWVDVILARINPFGTNMDAEPGIVNEILAKAQQNGKGIIGMKIFGEGKHVSDNEREQSIKYVVTQGNVHCVTLGLESESQMDDAVERVMRNVKEQ